MKLQELIPALFLVLVLILILPSFLKSNSKFSQFIKNLFIWSMILVAVIFVTYFLFNKI
jgi:hypothetical protein